jgi:hypothetical protein
VIISEVDLWFMGMKALLNISQNPGALGVLAARIGK